MHPEYFIKYGDEIIKYRALASTVSFASQYIMNTGVEKIHAMMIIFQCKRSTVGGSPLMIGLRFHADDMVVFKKEI
jgi:hypothetical protein